ncbi:PolC-type DNA polymerase III [uncultured Tyzzerella sp.]|uniref:PolC-type DNA polymerase III n=1 Tax=uncultured Tyzzerella sp. TaxID=2321398 RepID=UPI002942953F|nr:PolC-type DNA polymerase III [uncultured Tyzzerella sp.]
MEDKKFSNVFSKIKLSANVKTVLRNTTVDNIKINKNNALAEIFLQSNKIINENCLKDFEEDIFDNFKFLKEVKIYLEYILEDLTLQEKIEKIWSNIITTIREKSPMCFPIFKDATFEIEENVLHINLYKKGAFIFKTKKIDNIIQDIIKDRFNINIPVKFIDLDTGIDNTEQKNYELKELIAKALDNKNEPNIYEDYKENKTPEINRFRKTKRLSLKIKEFIDEKINVIKNSVNDGETIVIKGKIFGIDITETKKGKYIVKVDITDMTDSLSFKFFTEPEDFKEDYSSIIKKGNFVIVKGEIRYDEYIKELILAPMEICLTNPPEPKMDNSKEKRVELHLHTQMSKMDAVTPVKDMIKRASEWGHKAIAITDHGVVQAFPDAMDMARKLGIKVLYGVEAYLVDDLSSIVQASKNQNLEDEYVIFDLETTGLNREYNKIIEIGAVKVKNGKIIDRFSTFVNPHEKLTKEIIELTSITDEMLIDAPEESEMLPKFFEFFGDSVLVAHNAKFDMGFIKKWAERNNRIVENTVLDTVGLSRTIFPEMSKHTLNVIAKKLDISLENHHRAVDDAEATAHIFIKFSEILKNKYNIHSLDDVNELARTNIDVKKIRPTHSIILVKNQIGLRNLYELISKSNLEYFFREPRIPKSEFLKLREGLIIGTACENGEFYQAVLNNADEDEIEKLANFYDYFEIQPTGNNEFLIKNEKVSNINSIEDLQNINKKIIEYGNKYNKIVVATCDVHFLDKEDDYFRKIIMASKGYKDADNQPPLYFRTTEEMLEEFSYLGEDLAYEVVVKNTNIVADMIEEVLPIPDGTFPPEIEGSDKELTEITMKKAKSIYGEELPKIVKDRLERELNSIIKNGFAVLYIIAQKIVWNSNDNGYIVGSRGSVGSSFAATMAGITEVNPLSPHYFCKNCKYSDFESEDVLAYAGNSGWDLPDKICPVCSTMLSKDGHDIPFETFLGFEGDKEPDIDLNFSGEFQAQAHQYTEELFGTGYVFKAGTIGTLADKTAYGYVKKYADERNMRISGAEINRLVEGCVGIKRTTGQHPGGLMVVPNNKSIYDFCPVQRPADDPTSNVITTHFDYHSISGRILKLDLLGHDVPTILRMLKDFTGFDPLNTPMDDKATMSLFTSPNALGVTSEDIECDTGSLGLPEFGTPFVIQMLMDTNPNSFSDLVKISGLSHGTDVWFNNAQELIKNNVATLKEVIPTRDDIMVYLILKGVENKLAFTIMESVRKGKGLTPEFEQAMIDKNVPDWYIESCKRIKYMFPKGHAVAYVTNAFRMGYFKINYPYAFYASLFSVKSEDFDYDLMCFGLDKVQGAIKEIQELGKGATAKEKNKLVVLELVREMYKRGLKFTKMDLYKSKGFKFDVTEEGLLPPLFCVQGLGELATQNIVDARENGEFDTIENLVERTKISKTVVEILKQNGVLQGIPDTNQLTLFA